MAKATRKNVSNKTSKRDVRTKINADPETALRALLKTPRKPSPKKK